MFGAKKKLIGGIEYMVLGSTIERDGRNIFCKSYTTTKGIVMVKNGKVIHTDGSISLE